VRGAVVATVLIGFATFVLQSARWLARRQWRRILFAAPYDPNAAAIAPKPERQDFLDGMAFLYDTRRRTGESDEGLAKRLTAMMHELWSAQEGKKS
jgi:hypothetical protein